MDKQTVYTAYLQAATNLPGLGTYTTLSANKIPGVEMYMTDRGLIVQVGNQAWIVPSANVKVASLTSNDKN